MPKIAWAVLSYSFPDLSVPIPDPLKFFPVPLSREFARIIESFRGVAADGQGELGLIPRKFPVVTLFIRDFARSSVRSGLLTPPAHPRIHIVRRAMPTRECEEKRAFATIPPDCGARRNGGIHSLSPPFFSGPLDCAILVRIPQASDLLAFPGAMLSGLFVSRSGAHGGRAAPAAGANVSASPSVCPATRA